MPRATKISKADKLRAKLSKHKIYDADKRLPNVCLLRFSNRVQSTRSTNNKKIDQQNLKLNNCICTNTQILLVSSLLRNING